MTRRVQFLNIIVILIIIFSFLSCKNELAVSIFDPLPTELITKYTEKDSLFLNTYKEVRRLVDSIYKTPTANPEYSQLTYLRFYELDKKLRKEIENFSLDSLIIQSWNKKHKNDLVKFKQDSSQYRKYIEENDYSNFLDFELLRIYEKTVWVSTYNYAEILIKPKNGYGIRKVAGSVLLIPKDGEEKESEDFDTYKYANAYFSYKVDILEHTDPPVLSISSVI